MTSFPEEPIMPTEPGEEAPIPVDPEPEPIEPQNKTMMDRQKEVHQWAIDKGWRGEDATPRTHGEEVALMNTEVAEGTEAYRENGLKRWIVTYPEAERVVVFLEDGSTDYQGNKPEGVASEVIDTLIRLLDNYEQYDLGAPDLLAAEGVNPYENWGDAASALHHKITRVWSMRKQYAYLGDGSNWRNILSETYYDIMTEIVSVCYHFDIDIVNEYEAKMAYNRTRSIRHGGKNL